MNRRDTGCIDSAPIANSDHVYKKMNYKLLVVLNIILISLFTFDICYSFKYPHIVKRYKVSKYSIIKANH